LWCCNSLAAETRGLRDSLIDELKAGVLLHTHCTSPPVTSDWNSLTCLELSHISSHTFSFDKIVKGFIPSELVSFIRRFLSKNKADELILQSSLALRDRFHDKIWKPRCIKFAEFELSHGITESLKRQSKPSSSSATSSTIRQIPRSLWSNWVYRALDTNKSWSDFRTYINNLFLIF